jgi:hypothetical protein
LPRSGKQKDGNFGKVFVCKKETLSWKPPFRRLCPLI